MICALVHEADAAEALFAHHWDDDGPPYDKAIGDPNAYSTGAIGRHNVVLAHMPGMGKANAAAVAAHCRISFPNIRLAMVVGVCGVVSLSRDGHKVVLGDVVISNGVIQYDLGRRLPERFIRKGGSIWSTSSEQSLARPDNPSSGKHCPCLGV
ncbi:purine and uridine phosphorylase [Apiospora arundinis]